MSASAKWTYGCSAVNVASGYVQAFLGNEALSTVFVLTAIWIVMCHRFWEPNP